MTQSPAALTLPRAQPVTGAHVGRTLGQQPVTAARLGTLHDDVDFWEPATLPDKPESPTARAGSDNNCSDATDVPLTLQPDGHWTGSESLQFAAPLTEVAGSEYPSCHGGLMVCNNVWRTFVAKGTDAVIDCCTSTAQYPNSIIEVYSGTCSARVPLGCNDDSPGCAPGPTGDVGAKVLVSGLTIDETYIVQVGVRRYGTSGYTEGDYTLSIDCYTDCTIECTSLSLEDELQPCGDPENTHINDGCNMEEIPLFAQITCNESICGTSMFDGSTRDTDFYRWVTPVAATISYSAKAEFRASLLILGPQDPNLPISCDNYGLLADNDPNYFVPCADPGDTPLTLAVGPGEYWFFIAPSFDFGPVACGKQYQITLTASPCDPAPGACCVAGVCMSNTNQQDCVDIYSGVWYGDGSDCERDLTCFVCPEGAGAEGTFFHPDIDERTCDDEDYYPDVWNAGCGADTPDPTTAFTVINCGDTICGTSGTHLAPPAAPADNLRDNDWFMLVDLPGDAGSWVRISIEYLGEFPAEVHIVSHTDVDNPCETWTFEESRNAEPGELLQFSACVQKKAYAPVGHAWVIVRPYRRGAPREVPCGVHYYLTVDCAPCDAPGACCLGEGGCEMLTAAACEAGGGTFYNEGITCDDPIVCCPCIPGAIPENEPDCGTPPLNNGCWADDPGPPWLFSTIPAAGTHICGTLGDDDMDWYIYEHTGGLLRWCSTCERSVRMLILIPESDDPNTWCSDSMSGWELYTEFENCAEDCQEVNADAGTYFLFIRRNFPDSETMPCPTFYDAYADSVLTGACCIPDALAGECQVLSETECAAAGGEYLGTGTDCDPNPCCTFECDPDAVDEGEPDCGQPDDTTNGGCNSTPPIFDEVSLTGDHPIVCGTTQYDGETRDTDWYVYEHIGGDIHFEVATQFHGHVSIYDEFDRENPCLTTGGPNATYLGSADAPADCTVHPWFVEDVTPGYVLFVVVPEFEGEIVCGSQYQLSVTWAEDEPCDAGGPGPHWVDDTAAGNDQMMTTAVVALDMDLDCVTDASVELAGPIYVRRSAPLDDSVYYPGLRTIDGHLDVIDTEIAYMKLTGAGVELIAGGGYGQGGVLEATLGAIAEYEDDPEIAESFFDVFFELDLGGGLYAYNQIPLHVVVPDGIICVPPDAIFEFGPDCLPLYDAPEGGTIIANIIDIEHDVFPVFGACCIPDATAGMCVVLTVDECAAAGGVYMGDGVNCDPNPCCTFECDEDGVPEGESDCGLPEDTTNGGCNSDPPVFDDTSLNGPYPVVCGTVAFDGQLRDTDWYVYTHTGGDLHFFVATEYHGHVSIYEGFDPNDPCDEETGGPNATYRGSADTPADCGMYGWYVTEVAAGPVLLVVVPEFDYPIQCAADRGRYELAVASGMAHACCINDPEEGIICVDTWEAFCTTDPDYVSWHPETTCEESPGICGPTLCAGDLNCDGIVNYTDIDAFVAALSCVGGDPSCWPPPTGIPPVPPDCPWLNGDCDDDGNVTYADIDAFVGRIGQTCP